MKVNTRKYFAIDVLGRPPRRQCPQTLKSHGDMVYSVTFSHDSKLLASASWDKTVKGWDSSNGNYLQTLDGHSSGVYSVA